MKLDLLMEYTARLREPVVDLGGGPFGTRQIYSVVDGTFEGPRVRGRFLSGADWALQDAEGVSRLDLRFTLATDDGAMIYGQGFGIMKADPSRPSRPDGEPPDYGDMYFMSTPRFETGDERYKWLNDLVCVGEGKASPGDEEGIHAIVTFRLYAVLND